MEISESIFNEELVLNSDLNLQLSPNIFVLDLLKLQYTQPLSIRLVIKYLKQELHRYIAPDLQVWTELPSQLSSQRTIVLLSNWTLIYFNFYQNNLCVYIVSSCDYNSDPILFRISNRFNNPCIFQVNQTSLDYPQCYVIGSAARIFIKADTKDTRSLFQVVSQASNSSFIDVFITDITNTVYASSRKPAKIVYQIINQAKQLFDSEGDEGKEKTGYGQIVYSYPSQIMQTLQDCSEVLQIVQDISTYEGLVKPIIDLQQKVSQNSPGKSMSFTNRQNKISEIKQLNFQDDRQIWSQLIYKIPNQHLQTEHQGKFIFQNQDQTKTIIKTHKNDSEYIMDTQTPDPLADSPHSIRQIQNFLNMASNHPFDSFQDGSLNFHAPIGTLSSINSIQSRPILHPLKSPLSTQQFGISGIHLQSTPTSCACKCHLF